VEQFPVLTVISFDVGDTLVTYHYLDYVWHNVIPRLYADNVGVGYEEAEAFVLKEYDRIGPNDIGGYLPEYWFEHVHDRSMPRNWCCAIIG